MTGDSFLPGTFSDFKITLEHKRPHDSPAISGTCMAWPQLATINVIAIRLPIETMVSVKNTNK